MAYFKLLLTTTYTCWTVISLGQAPILNTLYRHNWMVLNPGAVHYTHLEDDHKINIANALYRGQWAGVEGAPIYYNLSYERFSTHVKLGGVLMRDDIGSMVTNSMLGNYAYIIRFNSHTFLSIGLNAGLQHRRLHFGELRFANPSQPFPDDDAGGQLYVDLALGAFYRWSKEDYKAFQAAGFKEFYAGVSAPNSYATRLNTKTTLPSMHVYYVLLGGIYRAKDGSIAIEPSIWLRYAQDHPFLTLYDGQPLSGDFNIRAKLYKKFWIGTGIGTTKWLHLETGIIIGKPRSEYQSEDYAVTLGFAYDVALGKTISLPSAFEVNLSYSWR